MLPRAFLCSWVSLAQTTWRTRLWLSFNWHRVQPEHLCVLCKSVTCIVCTEQNYSINSSKRWNLWKMTTCWKPFGHFKPLRLIFSLRLLSVISAPDSLYLRLVQHVQLFFFFKEWWKERRSPIICWAKQNSIFSQLLWMYVFYFIFFTSTSSWPHVPQSLKQDSHKNEYFSLSVVRTTVTEAERV